MVFINREQESILWAHVYIIDSFKVPIWISVIKYSSNHSLKIDVYLVMKGYYVMRNILHVD